ncbi:MAG: hypothetical protein JW910_04290 [Anaerolineae bacterium]|nr:hypothetical protein [Anaerolineae bacterium]
MQPSPTQPMLTLPRRGPRLTLLAIGYGTLIMGWLSLEDQGIVTVTLLALGAASLSVIVVMLNRLGGRSFTRGPSALLLAGGTGVAGALTAPIAALLMLLKTATHAHVWPDYPLTVIVAMLARTPAWGAAGLLAGVGLALLWRTLRRETAPH